MKEIEIIHMGGQGRWRRNSIETRMGREPSCDVCLSSDSFGMVSRQHVLLRWEEDGLWIEDLKTINGTFVDGNRVPRAKLRDGSLIRLGADGPEFQIRVCATAPLQSTHVPETRPASIGAGRSVGKGSSQIPPNAGFTGHAAQEVSEMGDPMLEQKINTLRTLTIALLIGVVVLAGLCVGLLQKVEKNQEAIEQMRMEARDSVARVRPDVDARIRKLDEVEAEVKGLDAKMQQAEDRMMQRLETELPRILDRFVERKLQELQNRQMQRR